MPNMIGIHATQQRKRKPEAPDLKSATLFRVWVIRLCFLLHKMYPERRRIGINHLNPLATFKHLMTYSVPLFDASPVQMSSG